MQVRLRFGLVARNPLRRSCVSRARNAGRASLLEEVSVLETWRTFGGSLVRNARFGDLTLEEVSYETLVLETWRFTFGESRTKRSFWRLGASLLEEILYETLVLETWLRFWRKSCTKRSFWRLGAALLEEVSYETLV